MNKNWKVAGGTTSCQIGVKMYKWLKNKQLEKWTKMNEAKDKLDKYLSFENLSKFFDPNKNKEK